MHVKPDFNGQIWQKSPKVDESSHVTHFSIATYEKIPNLCLIWSNSIILSVKCTSNRVLLVRNVKSPQVTWIMSYGPLYHCLFGEDNEFVPSLTFFGILWKNGIEQGIEQQWLVDLGGCMPYLTVLNRFDVYWTGKMTEFDKSMHSFGIPTKNAFNNNRGTHG